MSPKGTRRPVESATSRVQRLLTMVPWLVSRQGIELAEAARGLGVSETQLREDLDLIFMCGYGPMTDELIDVSYEAGRVFVTNAETISRPLRLGVDEAVAIVVALRALAASGVGGRDAISRALAKLEEATGRIEGVDRVLVAPDDGVDDQVLATAREALLSGRRVHLTYLVPSRDERTERDVDPLRLVSSGGRWYLDGWCRRAEDQRLFRLDRVETIEVLDAPADPPTGVELRDLSEGVYVGGPEDRGVVLELEQAARWVADYYPVSETEELGEGRLRVTLPTADDQLVVRLALRLGGHGRVVAPAELVAAVRERAEEALAVS